MKLFQKSARSLAKRLPIPLQTTLKRLTRRLERLQRRSYDRWVREFDTLSVQDRAAICRHIEKLEYKPVISLVMPTYETPQWVLREAIDSVRRQLYPNWELCVADDASSSSHVTEILRSAAADDRRIKWMRREVNGNISAASNSALSLASGEFIALMDHDDVLPPHALYEVAVALNENSRLDIIYSDEDLIDRNGRRHSPYFKTDWNIELLLGHNMVSHLGVFRRALVRRVGGFLEGFEGSQDYDLALRCADETSADRIHHIPAVLYHWRHDYGSRSFSERRPTVCSDAAQRAIGEHLIRRGEKGVVGPHPTLPQWSHVTRPVPSPAPLVSLIVPTRDRADLLVRCANGLLHRTDYPNIELLIVDHESALRETHELFEQLKSDSRVSILRYAGSLNASAISNMAAAQSRGSILGLINNDIEVSGAGWLSEMVSLAILREVGAVGSKLLYPNNKVQHGGIVLGMGRVTSYFNRSLPREATGYFGRNQLTSCVSGVTGACLIVRKSIYEEVGGLDAENLPVAFNDIDFCLKIRQRGYRNVWTPHAELYSYESASRDFGTTSAELRAARECFRSRWAKQLAHDPFYNENLSLEIGACFELAFPPRRLKPWTEETSE